MDKTLTERNTNMELLRVIAMIMIVLQHLGDKMEPLFTDSTLLVNELFCNFLRILGTNGVNCFVLVTGYFMIKKSFKLKRLSRLYFKVFIYGFVASCVLYFIGYANYSAFEWIENIFPVLTMRFWYVSIYFGLCLIIPFLNEFLIRLEQKKYFQMLAVGLLLFSVVSIITIEEIWVSRFIWFIYLYSVAAYVRLYPQKFKVAPSKCFLSSFIMLLLLWLSVQGLKFVGIYVPAVSGHIYYFTANWYIFDFIISLMLFLGCVNITLYSKPIIYGGKVTLAVYILHSTISPFEKIFKASRFLDSYLFIPYSLLCAVIVFVACGSIDIAVDKLIGNRIFIKTDCLSDKVERNVITGLNLLYEKYFK